MVRRFAACLLVLAGRVSAQETVEPPVWPVDLEAIAKKLEVAELPAVIDLVPADVAKELGELGATLSQAEIDDALEWSRGSSVAASAALRLFSQSGRSRTKAARLWREICACAVFSQGPRTSAVEEFVRDATGPAWQRALATPAWDRLRGLGASLLREHPDDPLVGVFLASYGEDFGVSVADRRHIAEQVVQRLGAAAMATDYLRACTRTLADLDVAAAKRWLAAAEAAPRPGCVAGRSWVAGRLFELRGRIAEAEALFAVNAGAPLDKQILHVRRLQVCAGREGALEECRRLIADDIPHALPFSIVAAEEVAHGNEGTAADLLARAVERPGRDVHTAVAMALCRLFPLTRRRAQSDEQRQQIEADVAAMLATADTILADDRSEAARLFAWMRKEVGLPPTSAQALGDALQAARKLQKEMPASRPAYLLVLASARLSSDDAAVREALRGPVPEPLAGLDNVVRLRAQVMLQRALAAGADDMDADIEHAFAELARVQQDECEANYLRGVLQWSRGIRARDDALLGRARDLFGAAQRPRSAVGWWRSASALCVANIVLGNGAAFGELMEHALLRDHPRDHLGVSLLAIGLLDAHMPPGLGRMALRAAADEASGVVAALHAATTVGSAGRGDAEGAREAARQALRALDDQRPQDLAPDAGVVCRGQFKWNFASRETCARFEIDLWSDLWVLPRLPDRESLQALAEGK